MATCDDLIVAVYEVGNQISLLNETVKNFRDVYAASHSNFTLNDSYKTAMVLSINSGFALIAQTITAALQQTTGIEIPKVSEYEISVPLPTDRVELPIVD